LLYYNHRYYSPELGRWLSKDPIGEAGGLNLYGMVGNDPVNVWDLLGQKSKCKCALTDEKKKKIQDAIDALRKAGFNKIADKLQKGLDDEKIIVKEFTGLDKALGGDAKTPKMSPDKIILNKKWFDGLSNSISDITELAAKLSHETKHQDQFSTLAGKILYTLGTLFGTIGPTEAPAYKLENKVRKKVADTLFNELEKKVKKRK
jgi:hypothetical protein